MIRLHRLFPPILVALLCAGAAFAQNDLQLIITDHTPAALAADLPEILSDLALPEGALERLVEVYSGEEGVRSEHNVVPWRRVQEAMLKVTAALEATRIDPNQRDRVAEGVRGGVRGLGWLELGGGYRRLPAEIKGGDRQGEVTWSSVVFARAGIHLGRRWGQKLTFPLLLDLGGGPSVLFHLRVHSGVRVQLSPSLYLGLRPIEPTYTVYEDDAAIPVRNGWDVRSSAEVLAEF